MIRHPIYLLLCLFAVGYLAIGDARGWSVFHSLSRSFMNTASGGRGAHGNFNHK